MDVHRTDVEQKENVPTAPPAMAVGGAADEWMRANPDRVARLRRQAQASTTPAREDALLRELANAEMNGNGTATDAIRGVTMRDRAPGLPRDTLIDSLLQRHGVELRVEYRPFRGQHYIDIRRWHLDGGARGPDHGLAIRSHAVPWLIRTLGPAADNAPGGTTPTMPCNGRGTGGVGPGTALTGTIAIMASRRPRPGGSA